MIARSACSPEAVSSLHAASNRGNLARLLAATLMIRRDTYEAAKAIAADPNSAMLGELAGTMDTEEFLGQFLDVQFEDTKRTT